MVGLEENTKKVSVLIRIRSDEHFIGYTIQSVLDHLGEEAEIVIINDDADEESLDIINSFSFSDIKMFTLDGKYSPGYALNKGVYNCKTDNILILSSHCTLTSVNLDDLMEQAKLYACVFGKQVPIWRGKRITPRYVWANFTDEEMINPYSDQEGRYFLHNACAFYSKDMLKTYAFRSDLHTKEDRYWANDVITHLGKEILYNPNALACNHHWTPNGATWTGIG